MSKATPRTRKAARFSAVAIGVLLLAYLIHRVGPAEVLHQVNQIGRGLALIIALGGINYLIRTYAWRLMFASDTGRLSMARLFALRLGSEAAGTFGLAGQVVGDAMRVSQLKPVVPVADAISSVALDRGFYIATSMMVNVVGLIAGVVLLSSSGAWRIYALIFAMALAALLAVSGMAIRGRWPLLSGAANALKWVPGLKRSLHRKQSVVASAEKHFLSFYHDRPGSFWASLGLNLACHGLAVLEVYILFHLMGARVSVLGAFVIEAFTKVVSAVGAINPGNVGTYEGGNMLLARLVGVTAAGGITVALCRRVRALFWAAVGALCLILMSRIPEETDLDSRGQDPPNIGGSDIDGRGPAIVVLSGTSDQRFGFIPELTQVGALPVLLRCLLSAQALRPSRLIVCVNSSHARTIKEALLKTRRLPDTVEWRTTEKETLPSLLRELAATAGRVLLLYGNRTYKPALLKDVCEWSESHGALALTTGGDLAGMYVVTKTAALEFANRWQAEIATLRDLNEWMTVRQYVVRREAPSDAWQEVTSPADRLTAERKLDSWLVKPTDGRFARMNRKVSIPISHQLIKFPITPNMVTLFTFGIGVASGFFFACGGYWGIVLGAFLSVWGSILDGCDGEVARIKLQASAFGCWLDTICDYIYYLVIFAGLTVGLNRSSGTNMYTRWGIVLMIGAAISFIVLGLLRRRMAGDHPETFLAVWQKEAERRSSNPLLYFGRHCEFIVRRCFFPYALLFFSILNVMNIAFIVAAIGSNLAWVIASYSWFKSLNRDAAPAGAKPEPVFQTTLDEVERAA